MQKWHQKRISYALTLSDGLSIGTKTYSNVLNSCFDYKRMFVLLKCYVAQLSKSNLIFLFGQTIRLNKLYSEAFTIISPSPCS